MAVLIAAVSGVRDGVLCIVSVRGGGGVKGCDVEGERIDKMDRKSY